MDSFSRPRRIGMGMYGDVYTLGECVAVKIPRMTGRESYDKDQQTSLNNEQEHIDFLLSCRKTDNGSPCPYIMAVFLQVPTKAIFTARATCDLRNVVHDTCELNAECISRWMGQMCGGVAFLERQGLVHGDLRPDNVLVYGESNRMSEIVMNETDLRLVDFGDTMQPIGEDHFGGEPFGRPLGPDEGEAVGTNKYGATGPRTEIFALGSIYYSLVRRFYPYEKENFGPETLRDKFSLKEFPELGEFPEPDQIIGRCWEGDAYYKSVAELEQVFRDMKDGTKWYRCEQKDAAWFAEQKRDCEAWVAEGGLDALVKRAEDERLKRAEKRAEQERKKRAGK